MGLHQEPLRPSLWRAGAGAGKTYNLVERVIRIAEDWSREHEGEMPRLVVTTFTRMATQELRVRLMQRVLELSSEAEPDSEALRKKLIPFVSSRSQLFVTTMHGVMESYLRAFAQEAGLDPAFRVAQADERRSMTSRVAHQILKDPVAESLVSSFGFRRSMGVLHRLAQIQSEFPEARPATLADLSRFWLADLAVCIPPILETEDEIKDSGNLQWEPMLEWFSLLKGALGEIQNELSLPRLDRIDQLLEARPSIQNRSNPKVNFSRKKWTEVFDDLSEATALVRNEWHALVETSGFNSDVLQLAERFWQGLTEEKRRSGLIELEDLELFSLRLLREHPETATTFAESWDHWLIDEYQDTSPRQVRLLEALSQGRSSFVVGDPQQSIYLFRGARPTVFEQRERLAKSERHAEVSLMVNRRSDPAVMDFINRAVDELGSDFEKMEPHRLEDSVAPARFGRVSYLQLAAGEDERAGERREREARAVAKAIRSLIDSGVRPASIAVLGRKNQDLMQIGERLDGYHVPYQVHTSGAFADRQEITDLASLLAFLVNPHDDANLIQLARAPWFPIDERILMLGYRRKTSLWSVLDGERLSELEVHRNLLQVARERGIVEAFKSALVSCDFFSFCGALDPSGRREANALKFITRLVTAERQAGFNPKRFIDEVLETAADGGSDRDATAAQKPDRVTVMTIHASKGLEFDHIFIPFMSFGKRDKPFRGDVVFHEEEKVFALSIRDEEDGSANTGAVGRAWMRRLRAWEREEDKRVLYVAMTRARESLFFSALGEAERGSFAALIGETLASESVRQILRIEEIDEPASMAVSSADVSDSCVVNAYVAGQARLGRGVRGTISVTKLLEMEQTAVGETALHRAVVGSKSAQKSLGLARKAANGTRLHRVFELAKYLTDQPDAMAGEIARWFPLSEREAAGEALQWLLNLREPAIAEIFSSGEVEWSFVYRRELAEVMVAVEGQIDLWGRDASGQLWVVDYKTGASEYSDKAIRQLRYYAEALLAAGVAKKGEVIKLAAVYPFSREVVLETV